MKQTVTWFNLQRYGTENRLSNIRDNFESLQLEMSVLHQGMYIFKVGLSSSYVMTAGEIYRKSTWCQRSQSKCWNNLQFQTQIYITLIFIHQKGSEKLVKDELYVLCIANTAILNM